MLLGRVAGLVASMPSWIGLIIDQNELELNPAPGASQSGQPSTAELVSVHDGHVREAREALSKATDDFLLTTGWRLLVNGNVVMEDPRHVVLRDTFNHLAHHRGQLTVYLRLLDRTAPSIDGPTADDQRFL